MFIIVKAALALFQRGPISLLHLEKHAWINLSQNQDVQVKTKKLETEEEKEDIVPKWGEILFAVQ